MRSENYGLQEQTFTRFEPQHMVRAALVEGLKSENPRHNEYKGLVQRYTGLPPGNIERLHYLLQQEQLSRTEALALGTLLPSVYPRGERGDNAWKQLNYDALRSEGVIVAVKANLDEIVDRAVNGKTWQVLALEEPIIEREYEIGLRSMDYRKHIPRRNKIVLDSEQTINAFSQQHNMTLHPHWNGQMNDDLIRRLRGANYSLNDAILTALSQQQNSGRKHSVISFTNYTSGDDVRIFPIDLVEMVEIFTYFREHKGAAAIFKLGDEAQKYAGTKTLLVPKRHPT
ncbi:MAG: hypothetical protein AABX34_00670, partial [Nanoarchaeota archaeon]